MKQIHGVIWQENDWFIAKALEVEVTSQGRTKKEATENLKEALELYFEDRNPHETTLIKAPKLQNISIQVNA